jgi:hypothetical protein
MRRLITACFVLAVAALATAQAAHGAAARVGPPLKLSVASKADGSEALVVAGRGCRPTADAPASVLVTVQELTGKVFTATPDSSGHWSVEIPIADPNDFSFTVSAECDDYFGTKTYPQAGLGVAAASASVPPATPGGRGQDQPPVTARTGSQTAAEIGIGLSALALGGLCVWFGRPRRA